MTRFDVDWLPDALDDLADIWLQASDRDAVNFAAAMIDARLAASPSEVGTAISEGLYELTVSPLRVLFVFDDAKGNVEILRAFPSRIGPR